MANRTRGNATKVETLIETCRSEGKWQRVIELTDELKTGSPHNGKGQMAMWPYGIWQTRLTQFVFP